MQWPANGKHLGHPGLHFMDAPNVHVLLGNIDFSTQTNNE
jgi:hypothetical protein